MKQNRIPKKPATTILTLIIIAGLYLFGKFDASEFLSPADSSAQVTNTKLIQAIKDQRSDVQVLARGTIVKVLPDDTKGSQHQRLLVKLPTGEVILIAHNIDLAPRIDGPQEGKELEFYGEFEWNKKGGVVHWTHHDPRGKHPHGWLKYEGKKYE